MPDKPPCTRHCSLYFDWDYWGTWCGYSLQLFYILPVAAFAQTEKRVALLIGNKDCKPGVGALTNPLNDIRVVGDALKSVGF